MAYYNYMAFNEDTRVKIPATIHFMRLGYNYQPQSEIRNVDFNTKIFVKIFKDSIEKINGRVFSPEEIESIIRDIHKSISNEDLGQDFFNWLINPVERVKLIDFDNIDNNDFSVVDELPFTIEKGVNKGSFRPDINILINGMPLAFLEVKKPNNEGGIQVEFDRMVEDRLTNDNFKKFFRMIQIISFSNNMSYDNNNGQTKEDIRAGSFYSTPNDKNTTFSVFKENDASYYSNYKYKTVKQDEIERIAKDLIRNNKFEWTPEFKYNLDEKSNCNKFITSMFDKERLLFMIKYGITFVQTNADTSTLVPTRQKHIMRYPQFFATRKIIERLESGSKRGIIWHTQGSGKTALAAFSNKIIRDYYAKKNVVTQFFFVVDRLDLLRQAASEFSKRGLSVIKCNSREEFEEILRKPILAPTNPNSMGEVIVVNIQKFTSNLPKVSNPYGVNLQRVFFIDEAHRSYTSAGKFFNDLIQCDEDAVFIALTGTPILKQSEKTSLKFGDYIHIYFYDESIADGYTLKIIKEKIDTAAKSEIKINLDIQDKQFDEADIYESDDYVACLGKFILEDFRNFRYVNANDQTLGAMVVCRSNTQARKMNDWINANNATYHFKSGLVMSDEDNPSQQRKNEENQDNFKNMKGLDILVVHYMLTTGYDVSRLKKLYLLRGPKEQSLLQTISRVNRPYQSQLPDGSTKTYYYGHIVDFMDIQDEYDSTITSYRREIEKSLGEDGEEISLNDYIKGEDEIRKQKEDYIKELNQELEVEDVYSLNVEVFGRKVSKYNSGTIRFIRGKIVEIENCNDALSIPIGTLERVTNRKLLRELNSALRCERIIKRPIEMLSILDNKEVIEVIYNFTKDKPVLLEFSDIGGIDSKVGKLIRNIQSNLKDNGDNGDLRIEKLDKLLQDIFLKLNIAATEDEINAELKKLEQVSDELHTIKKENEELAARYGGSMKYVKAVFRFRVDHPQRETEQFNLDDIKAAFGIIYNMIGDFRHDEDNLKAQGLNSFIAKTRKSTVSKMLDTKSSNGDPLYVTLKLNDDKNFTELLSILYDTLTDPTIC